MFVKVSMAAAALSTVSKKDASVSKRTFAYVFVKVSYSVGEIFSALTKRVRIEYTRSVSDAWYISAFG
jgi:hypothetical protein